MHDSTKTDPLTEFFGEVISTYSRAQAIEDGVLVDAGEMATEVGFRIPVALTAAAWSDCVVWSHADSEHQVHQDQSGAPVRRPVHGPPCHTIQPQWRRPADVQALPRASGRQVDRCRDHYAEVNRRSR